MRAVACASGTSLGTAPGGALAAVPEGFASARAVAEDAPACGVEADGAAAAAPGLLAADEGEALPDAPRAGGRSGIAGAEAPGAAGAACRSARACMSVSGPLSVACSVSGTGACAPGTGAVSAPASATSS